MAIKMQFDTKQAATFLGTSYNVLCNLRHQKRGPVYVKEGHRIYYRRDDLMTYIKDQTKVVYPKAKS
jgi:hypothetical protein